MVLSLLFLASSWIFGLAVLEFIESSFPLIIKNALATVLGFLISTLFVFLASLIFNSPIIYSVAMIIPFALICFFYLVKKRESFKIFETFSIRKNLFFTIVFSSLILVTASLFFLSIFVTHEGIFAGNRLVWTDWPVHISITSSFANGKNFPPQNPLYSGPLISYPFFADFLSAIFLSLGLSLKSALVLPSILLTLSSIALLYYLGLLLTKSRNISLLGIVIGLFPGGIGFVYFLQDLTGSTNIWQTLTFPPHEYTFYAEKNLWLFSFLYSELLAQRAFLFGLPMFLISVTFFLLGLTNSKKNYLLASGYILGLMLIFHPHSFISASIFIGVFSIITLAQTFQAQGFRKALRQLLQVFLYLGLPAIGLFLIQLPIFKNINLSQTLGIHLGWANQGDNIVVFWFKNTGLFWPLFAFGILFTESKYSKIAAFASVAIFAVANIVRFAPWIYDNLKILTYWYLIAAFFVASTIVRLYQRNFLGKFMASFLIFSLTASGIVEVGRVFNVEKAKIQIWSQEDLEMAKTVMEKTEPQSVILAATVHDHPVTGLAGRKIIIGFPGNAWSWGVPDWYQREQDVHSLFRANPTEFNYLIEKYKINYVFIGPKEKVFEPNLNEGYFKNNYEFIGGEKDYKIYKVR